MTVETVNPAVPWDSDKLTSVSPMTLRARHVYVRKSATDACRDCYFSIAEQRVTWSPGAGGEMAFRLSYAADAIEATCLVERCTVVNLFSGQRIATAPVNRGAVSTFRLPAEVIIGWKR